MSLRSQANWWLEVKITPFTLGRSLFLPLGPSYYDNFDNLSFKNLKALADKIEANFSI